MYRPSPVLVSALLLSLTVFVSARSAQAQSNTASFEIFSDPTHFGVTSSQVPAAAIIGDFNKDGKPDIVAATYNSDFVANLSFIAGNGDGSFQTATTVYTATANTTEYPLLAVDLNHDGNLDLITTSTPSNSPNPTPHIFLGNGNGTFGAPMVLPGTLSNFVGLAVADFNGDGYPDIAVAYGDYSGSASGTIQIFTNSGAGLFTLAKTIAASTAIPTVTSLSAADVDEDGHVDLVVGTNSSLVILWGTGPNTFTTPSIQKTYTGPQVNSVVTAIADTNQDGAPDVLTTYSCATQPAGAGRSPSTNTCQGVDVFYGGQGKQKTFYRNAITDTNVNALTTPLAVDVNGDGIADIVASGVDETAANGLFVWYGHPDGSFDTAEQRFIVATEHTGGALMADFNRDGRMDFFTQGTGNEYLNATPLPACARSTIASTVTVCQPINNTSLPSNDLKVHAMAYSSSPVTSMQEYVDGQLLNTQDTTDYTLPISLSPGTHTLVTKAWNSQGVSFRSDRTINLYTGTAGDTCTAPYNGAAICLPGDNTAAGIHILGNGSTQAVPTAAQLYVDGSLVYNDTVSTTAVDMYLKLATGTHSLVFKLYDANGNVVTASASVNAQ